MGRGSIIAVIIILILMLSSLLSFEPSIQTVKAETYFSYDFNDGVADGWTKNLGNWQVIDGRYSISVGGVENGITTVTNLSLADCTIETKLRFTDPVGFRAGIVFRYLGNEQYYAFELSNEYDCYVITKYTQGNSEYGTNINWGTYPIQRDIDYILKVETQGNRFRCFVNGQEVLNGTDNSYSSGKVGLRARRADVAFDYFGISELENPSGEFNLFYGVLVAITIIVVVAIVFAVKRMKKKKQN